MSEREEYTPSMYEIKTFSVWRPDTFDRALAAHDRALREEIARDIEAKREEMVEAAIAVTGGLPTWLDPHTEGVDDALAAVRGKEQTNE